MLTRLLRAALAGAFLPAGIAASTPAAATGTAATTVASSADSPVTWGVVPSSADGPDGRTAFEYELDPGGALTDWLAVFNHSDDELTLAVYAHDAFTTAGGGFDLMPADAEPTGVGSWVTLDASAITIPARSRVDIPFELTVPGDATPGDHAGGIVATLISDGSGEDGEQVLVEHRVGARIYLRVSGELRPALEITEINAGYTGTVNPVGSGSLTATYTVSNTGNVRLAGLPVAEVAGPFGLARRSVTADPLPEILPGDSYAATIRIDGVLPLVRLTATVDVQPTPPDDFAVELDPPPASGVAGVWAPPWAFAMLVALLATAIVIWVRRRRRAKANLAATIEAARKEGAAAARAAAVAGHSSPATADATSPSGGDVR